MTRNRIRWLGMVLVVLAALSGVVITGSATTTTADRALSVTVADDTAGYIAIEDCTVRNHHQTAVIVELTQNETTETVRLAPGEQHGIDDTGELELTVTEDTGAIEMSLSRELSCGDTNT